MKEIFTSATQPGIKDDEILVVGYISAFAIRQNWSFDKPLNGYFIGRASEDFDHTTFAKAKPRQLGMGTPGYMIVKVSRAELEAAKYELHNPKCPVEILSHSLRFIYAGSDHIKSFKLMATDTFVDNSGLPVIPHNKVKAEAAPFMAAN